MKLSMMFFILLIGSISSLSAKNNNIIRQEMTERDLCHKVLDCLSFVDSDFSTEKAIDDLYKARLLLVEQGYKVPFLSEIFEKIFERTERQGVFLDRDFIEGFYELILLKEQGEARDISYDSRYLPRPKIIYVKKKKDNNKEIKVPDGVAIGFCKALAGGLLCIIPSGITQTLGTGLILSGLNDMIQHANDPINDGSGSGWESDLNHRQRIGTENASYD